MDNSENKFLLSSKTASDKKERLHFFSISLLWFLFGIVTATELIIEKYMQTLRYIEVPYNSPVYVAALKWVPSNATCSFTTPYGCQGSWDCGKLICELSRDEEVSFIVVDPTTLSFDCDVTSADIWKNGFENNHVTFYLLCAAVAVAILAFSTATYMVCRWSSRPSKLKIFVWKILVIFQACLVILAFLLPSGGLDIPEMIPDPLAELQSIKTGIIVGCTLIAVLPLIWRY